jgi:hypothetical protein
MPKERHSPSKRIVLANEEEPLAGDFSFVFYDKANPNNFEEGDDEVQDRFRKALRGLRGHEVRMIVRGERRNTEGSLHRFRGKATFTYNTLEDVFSAQGAYLRAMHNVVEVASDEEMITTSVEFESLEE